MFSWMCGVGLWGSVKDFYHMDTNIVAQGKVCALNTGALVMTLWRFLPGLEEVEENCDRL